MLHWCNPSSGVSLVVSWFVPWFTRFYKPWFKFSFSREIIAMIKSVGALCAMICDALYFPFLQSFPFAKRAQELSWFPAIMWGYLNQFKIRALNNKIPLPIIVFIWNIYIHCRFLEIVAPNYVFWSNFCKPSPKQCIRRLCNMGWPGEHFLAMAIGQLC